MSTDGQPSIYYRKTETSVSCKLFSKCANLVQAVTYAYETFGKRQVNAQLLKSYSVIPAFADMVKGYPSLVWVPKGDKQNPQKYSGGRAIEDFRSWIAENGSSGKKEEL